MSNSPNDSYMRAINLMGLQEVLAKHGHDVLPLMEEVGIPLSALKEIDTLISFDASVAAWETAAERFEIPNLGLEISLFNRPQYTNLGPLMMMARFVNNLEEWIETGLRYWKFHTNGFSMKLIKPEGEDVAIFRMISDPFSLPARHFSEGAIANIVGIAREALELPDVNPRVVRFEHRAPADTTMLQDYFRCPIEFGQMHTEIVLERDLLNKPTSGSLKLFKPLMALYITERIRRMRMFDRSTSSTVALAIPSIIGTGNCNIDMIAESLNRNAKMLQRQLAKEGTNFSEILEKVREAMARHLLTDTDAQVAQIAGLLDYASAPPFTTAFRRWTGKTPLEYRQFKRIKEN